MKFHVDKEIGRFTIYIDIDTKAYEHDEQFKNVGSYDLYFGIRILNWTRAVHYYSSIRYFGQLCFTPSFRYGKIGRPQFDFGFNALKRAYRLGFDITKEN